MRKGDKAIVKGAQKTYSRMHASQMTCLREWFGIWWIFIFNINKLSFKKIIVFALNCQNQEIERLSPIASSEDSGFLNFSIISELIAFLPLILRLPFLLWFLSSTIFHNPVWSTIFTLFFLRLPFLFWFLSSTIFHTPVWPTIFILFFLRFIFQFFISISLLLLLVLVLVMKFLLRAINSSY